MKKKATLSLVDAVMLIVGIVVGVGIFRAPSLVASNTGGTASFFLAWIAGGAVSLVGALCYAELAAAYPHAGGDYNYLGRAFGSGLAFLFAWSRMTVIQTGSIAMLAFVLGDYLAQIAPIGPLSSPVFAAVTVAALTIANIMGVRTGKLVQNLLTAAKAVGLFLVVLLGILWTGEPAAAQTPAAGPPPAFGLAMIFVLLTYGGWNEAVYISSELRNGERNILRALIWGIGCITVLYLLLNFAYWKVLSIQGIGAADAVASHVMARIMGPRGALFIDVLVCLSALGAVNASIITGARSNFALGQDFRYLSRLGLWNERKGTPTNALLLQGAIALLLILFGVATRQGFVTTVEYTAPVFWLFFLLTTVSLLVLRRKEPARERPFKVPFYPVIPLAFAAVCCYMLVASLRYTGTGALVGIAVVLSGVPVFLLHKGAGPPRSRE